MGADVADLLVQRRLGDLAFLDVLHQPAVGADEADVQLLLRLVPLAADHDAVAVAVGRRTRNDRRNFIRRNFPDALEQIRYLLVLQPQLRRIGDVLILAAAARAKITALRRDALRRRLLHAKQFCPRKILFDLGDFGLNGFADQHERDEHDEIVHAPDAFATERDVVNGQTKFVADVERHMRV